VQEPKNVSSITISAMQDTRLPKSQTLNALLYLGDLKTKKSKKIDKQTGRDENIPYTSS
jgi:hypothetical protein